jgi:small-conductance mechanosensitive channel
LAGILGSLRKAAVFLLLIVIIATATVLFFELFVAEPINLPALVRQVANIAIVFIFFLPVIYVLSQLKQLLTPHLGVQAATILQFIFTAFAIIAIVFIVLDIVGVPLTTLITSAGIISVTIGLIVSTFVGGILSGALVLTTHQLKIGEDVMVNNMPGRIVDMTALVLRIRTDVGQITIPNSAVASGGVIITAVRPPQPAQETRLPYVVGDRVVTSYRNEEGIVTELTAFHTTVLLDSGRQITFLNNTVLIGATAIAKITQKPPPS